MGVYISLNLSDSITQKEWNAVYEKSLIMAEKFGFYEYAEKEISDVPVKCLIPTKERELWEGVGWRVIGSFPEYQRGEEQFTPKFFGKKSYNGPKFDVLRFYEQDYASMSIGKHTRSYIWNNKTQGAPYHMYLLAIGCMAEQMLGVQAIIRGDITYGQCVKAAKMATDVLGEEIVPPVSCRLEALYERINRLDDLDEYSKLNILKNIYIGVDYNKFGELQKKHFSEETIRKYWGEKLKIVGIETIGFSVVMQEYFSENDDLKRFCNLADFDKSDKEKCTELIRKILGCSMHVKEKDCYDPFDLKQRSDPYDVDSLFASFFSGMVCDPVVDRFIPLEEMRKVFTECFGDILNVDEVIDSYLEEKNNSIETILEETIKKHTASSDSDESDDDDPEYDVYDYEDMVNYKPGCTFFPEFLASIKRSFKTYVSLNESEEFKELMTRSQKYLFEILALNIRSYMFTYDHWKTIYRELMRDKEAFRRYYPMLRVSRDGKYAFLIRAFVTDDDFWKFCCENYEAENKS